MLFAAIDFTFLIPLVVFVGFVGAVWAVLSMISNRNSRAQDRLARPSRPQSLADIDVKAPKKERFQGVMDTAKALSGPLMPGTELEQSALKTGWPTPASAAIRPSPSTWACASARCCSFS